MAEYGKITVFVYINMGPGKPDKRMIIRSFYGTSADGKRERERIAADNPDYRVWAVLQPELIEL